MNKSRIASYGFTLIELMVTVALIAILLAVAAPSLSTFQRNAELTSATNTMLSAINAARGEAMKRGVYASVVPADAANWNSGWIVFVDKNRNGVFNSTVDTIVMTKEAPPTYLKFEANSTATGSAPYIMYDASGYSTTKSGSFSNLTFTIAIDDIETSDYSQIRRMKIEKTGRVRACKPLSLTDANCSR